MKISDKGIELIKISEGCRLTAYKCSAGVWTIGYGHTTGVKRGATITETIAHNYLIGDIRMVETQLDRLCAKNNVHLTQGQWDALVSFVFNLGIGALEQSTLWRMVIANPNDKAIAAQFRRWVYAGGKRQKGLVDRREKEIKLYYSHE